MRHLVTSSCWWWSCRWLYIGQAASWLDMTRWRLIDWLSRTIGTNRAYSNTGWRHDAVAMATAAGPAGNDEFNYKTTDRHTSRPVTSRLGSVTSACSQRLIQRQIHLSASLDIIKWEEALLQLSTIVFTSVMYSLPSSQRCTARVLTMKKVLESRDNAITAFCILNDLSRTCTDSLFYHSLVI